MCLDIGIQSVIWPSRFSLSHVYVYIYMCVDPFMRVSSSEDIVLFFNRMLAGCMCT
jgi:hypothetical protein